MERQAPHRPDARDRREVFDRREFLGVALGGAAGVAAAPPTAMTAPGTGQLPTRTLDAVPDAGAWVELDAAAVSSNLAAVRAAAGGRPVMGVVKANAYGHGLVPTARLLADAGVDALMVITVDEALAVRDAGIDVPLLNYGPFDASGADELVRRRVDQAVFTRAAVEGMAAAAGRVGRRASVQLILDTGLGRVGAPFRDADEIFVAAQEHIDRGRVSVGGLATALTEDEAFDRVQLGRYLAASDRAARRGFAVGVRHVASSAAVLDFPEAHLDMVRPGIMLYGHYPNERSMGERPIELVPVMSLRAKVAYVKTMRVGDSIGYHRAWVAERETTVATLPIGHSEGYPSGALAAAGAVEIHGRACQLVGGVTSNHLEVAIPDGIEVAVGDTATLIAGGVAALSGPGQVPASAAAASREAPWLPTAQQVGRWGGAGVYGALMHVNPLLPRLIT